VGVIVYRSSGGAIANGMTEQGPEGREGTRYMDVTYRQRK
jgi:hypothetical protein